MNLDEIFEHAKQKRCPGGWTSKLLPEHRKLLNDICERYVKEGRLASKVGLHEAFARVTKTNIKIRAFSDYLREYRPQEQSGVQKEKRRG